MEVVWRYAAQYYYCGVRRWCSNELALMGWCGVRVYDIEWVRCGGVGICLRVVWGLLLLQCEVMVLQLISATRGVVRCVTIGAWADVRWGNQWCGDIMLCGWVDGVRRDLIFVRWRKSSFNYMRCIKSRLHFVRCDKSRFCSNVNYVTCGKSNSSFRDVWQKRFFISWGAAKASMAI